MRVGFTAAFLAMLFPRPTSARQVVRRNIARCIQQTGDLYEGIVGGVNEAASETGEVDSEARLVKHRSDFLAILVSPPRVPDLG